MEDKAAAAEAKEAAEAQLKGLLLAGLPQHCGGVLPGKLKSQSKQPP
jgi:hypothetical protein